MEHGQASAYICNLLLYNLPNLLDLFCKNLIKLLIGFEFLLFQNVFSVRTQVSGIKQTFDPEIRSNFAMSTGLWESWSFQNFPKNLDSQYDFLKTFVKKLHIGPFNIQKYYPGDHFNKIHAERTDMSTIHRIFAWMTYLNDVEDGGTTDFDYYKIKVKPKTGKTLIWPAEWTHAHYGSVLKSGEKFIITGWIDFKE